MKPAPFEYFDPRELDEALERLQSFGDDAKILAGGQSLMPMLNLRLARPAVLVDINRLPGLVTFTAGHGTVRLGALVRQRSLERWASSHHPLLAAALRVVGHAAIRNRGTVAGNIAHADPASELPALLLCLDGAIVVRSRAGSRQIAAADFFQGPLMTALRSDELVMETHWRLPAPGMGWGFHEVARRHGDFALAGAVAVVTLHGGRIDGARVALFGVGPSAVRAAAAEHLLTGQTPSPKLLVEAAAAATEGLDPHSDLHASAAYRRRVAETLTGRALTDALARATT
ncbi:MAG: FAD binding domain-containing protein [Candidatus Rokuibacteriota bacterium]